MKCAVCSRKLNNNRYVIPIRKMGAPKNRIYVCAGGPCWDKYLEERAK